jgi:diguanylate cyclase (GGDEF)-like protein
LMVDVDHFKLYNDRWGHQAGDLVLTAIGSCIASCTRSSTDFAARYGGEEFAVLLPGASLLEALAIAQRIRSSVANFLTDDDSKADFPTVSIGVATRAPRNTISEAELVTAADKALYEAKRCGRNQAMLESLIPNISMSGQCTS